MFDDHEQESISAMRKRLADEHAAAKLFHDKMLTAGVFPSCVNCLEFNQLSDKCMKYNAKPPAAIIARSCPEWEMYIPF